MPLITSTELQLANKSHIILWSFKLLFIYSILFDRPILKMLYTYILFKVSVPVLSKQIVVILALSTVFYDWVPIIFALFNLAKQKEYAKLKNIGNGPGKQYVIKSRNLKITIVRSISKAKSWGSESIYMRKLITKTYTWNDINLKKNSGWFITLVKILRIIFPLWEE